jgi:hypothetical protein
VRSRERKRGEEGGEEEVMREERMKGEGGGRCRVRVTCRFCTVQTIQHIT